MRRNKGQSIAEYALVLAIASMVFAGMNIYVKRALQSRYKAGSDYVLTAVGKDAQPRQYEPYYTSEDMTVESQNQSRDAAQEDGTRSGNSDETVSRWGTQTVGISIPLTLDPVGPPLNPPLTGRFSHYARLNPFTGYIFYFNFPNYSVDVRVVIKDDSGNIIRHIYVGYCPASPGLESFIWDCRDDSGNLVTAMKNYTIEITGVYVVFGYQPYTYTISHQFLLRWVP